MKRLEKDLKGLSLQQETGYLRDSIDKFYTKRPIALFCITHLHPILLQHSLQQSDLFLEPSAGDGAFVEATQTLFPDNKCDALDITPEEKTITKEDFLTVDVTRYTNKRVHVVGNPPFGRQSSTAKKFIKHCCKFAQSISFILPKSFKKSSFQQTFDPHFHLLLTVDLPSYSFLVNNVEHDVPCVFQIWYRKEETRHSEEKVDSIYFSYVKKEEQPTICIRRVGVNAGDIFTEIEGKSPQSHYFLSLKDVSPQLFVENYKANVLFTFDNTVGPKSISKQELNKATNQLTF